MKHPRWLLLLAGLLPLIGAAVSAPPMPKITVSENGLFCFLMFPPVFAEQPSADGTHAIVQDARGVAFGPSRDGTLKESWRTEGWYSSVVFLSNNGRHLVRLNSTISYPAIGDGLEIVPSNPKPEDTAVEFYEDGKLLRRYAVTELVKEPHSVRNFEESYSWLSPHSWEAITSQRSGTSAAPHLLDNDEFRLTTCDDTLYRFNAHSGDILESRPPEMLRPFPGAPPGELQRIAVQIGVIDLPLPIGQCESALGLSRWETKTVHQSAAGAPSPHHALFALTSPDEPRGYFELRFDLRDHIPTSANTPEKGELVGIHLLFRSPDGTCSDCIAQMCEVERDELWRAREVAKYAKRIVPPEHLAAAKQLPIYRYWFRRYYAQPE